jgi:hypothetical protein
VTATVIAPLKAATIAGLKRKAAKRLNTHTAIKLPRTLTPTASGRTRSIFHVLAFMAVSFRPAGFQSYYKSWRHLPPNRNSFSAAA